MKKLLTTLGFISLFFTGAIAQQTEADFKISPTCFDDSTTLTSTSSVHPLDSIVIYAWDLDGDLSFDDTTGRVIRIKKSSSQLTHDIGLKITTKFNITKSVYKQLQIIDVNADFDFSGQCEGDLTEFQDLSTAIHDDIVSWSWVIDTSLGIGSFSPDPEYTFPSYLNDYPVTLMVETQNGCTDEVTRGVSINPVPEIREIISNFPPIDDNADPLEYQFYEGEILTLTLDIFGSYETIEWSDNQTGPTASFGDEGPYSVTVTDFTGCFTVADFIIQTTLRNDFDPTDVITPNGDGKNDVWYIRPNLLNGDSYTVEIYNRWGDQVYSSSNYGNDWDGTYEGNPLPEGAYYYVAKNNNNPGEVRKGVVNIVTR